MASTGTKYFLEKAKAAKELSSERPQSLGKFGDTTGAFAIPYKSQKATRTAKEELTRAAVASAKDIVKVQKFLEERRQEIATAADNPIIRTDTESQCEQQAQPAALSPATSPTKAPRIKFITSNRRRQQKGVKQTAQSPALSPSKSPKIKLITARERGERAKQAAQSPAPSPTKIRFITPLQRQQQAAQQATKEDLIVNQKEQAAAISRGEVKQQAAESSTNEEQHSDSYYQFQHEPRYHSFRADDHDLSEEGLLSKDQKDAFRQWDSRGKAPLRKNGLKRVGPYGMDGRAETMPKRKSNEIKDDLAMIKERMLLAEKIRQQTENKLKPISRRYGCEEQLKPVYWDMRRVQTEQEVANSTVEATRGAAKKAWEERDNNLEVYQLGLKQAYDAREAFLEQNKIRDQEINDMITNLQKTEPDSDDFASQVINIKITTRAYEQDKNQRKTALDVLDAQVAQQKVRAKEFDRIRAEGAKFICQVPRSPRGSKSYITAQEAAKLANKFIDNKKKLIALAREVLELEKESVIPRRSFRLSAVPAHMRTAKFADQKSTHSFVCGPDHSGKRYIVQKERQSKLRNEISVNDVQEEAEDNPNDNMDIDSDNSPENNNCPSLAERMRLQGEQEERWDAEAAAVAGHMFVQCYFLQVPPMLRKLSKPERKHFAELFELYLGAENAKNTEREILEWERSYAMDEAHAKKEEEKVEGKENEEKRQTRKRRAEEEDDNNANQPKSKKHRQLAKELEIDMESALVKTEKATSEMKGNERRSGRERKRTTRGMGLG